MQRILQRAKERVQKVMKTAKIGMDRVQKLMHFADLLENKTVKYLSQVYSTHDNFCKASFLLRSLLHEERNKQRN